MKVRLNYNIGDSKMGSPYYVYKALIDLGHTVIHQYQDPKDLDLVMNIDGNPLLAHERGVPSLYWETDSFMTREFLQEDHGYKQVFIGGAPEDLKKYPKGTVFLPHAFDEELHKPLDVPKEWDIVMIGSMYPERYRLLELLRTKFTVFTGKVDPGLSYSETLSKGKLIFNRSMTDWNIPMRFFEGMGIGTLLTNDSGNLDTLGEDRKHFITYKTDDDLLELATYYLKNDEERERIAKDARKYALKHHTYKHRVKTMLSYL